MQLFTSAFYERIFIQGETHSCTIFTDKQPFVVRVGFLLPPYWWQMLAKCNTGREVQKYSFCVYGVTIANVMFAYFEIKNQYTITYREWILHSICCEKVMDFLISSLLLIELNEEWGSQQSDGAARGCAGAYGSACCQAWGLENATFRFQEISHAPSWCLVYFFCKAKSELLILVVQYASGRELIFFL